MIFSDVLYRLIVPTISLLDFGIGQLMFGELATNGLLKHKVILIESFLTYSNLRNHWSNGKDKPLLQFNEFHRNSSFSYILSQDSRLVTNCIA